MLEKVKEYLRIDGDGEDIAINSLITAAKTYIKNATGVDVIDTDDLHILAVSLLVTHWYDNREIIGSADKLKFSLDSILMQIEYGSGSA